MHFNTTATAVLKAKNIPWCKMGITMDHMQSILSLQCLKMSTFNILIFFKTVSIQFGKKPISNWQIGSFTCHAWAIRQYPSDYWTSVGQVLISYECNTSWWRHQMETFSALLALCAGNSPVIGEFPLQRPVTRSFDVFFDLPLNKQLSKQSWSWWFETPSCSLWCHCNDFFFSKGTWFYKERSHSMW